MAALGQPQGLPLRRGATTRFFHTFPALGPEGPLVRGSPSGAKEKVSTRELSLVLPPLAGLDQRLGLVSQGLRPGLSSIAR